MPSSFWSKEEKRFDFIEKIPLFHRVEYSTKSLCYARKSCGLLILLE